jgi:hypothetical protein
MKTKFKLFSLTSLCAFVIFGFTFVFLYKPDREVIAETEYPYDITDKKQIVNSAEYVFVGTVSEIKDVERDELGVYTPYMIKIDENLKGELALDNEVLVSQRIGYDNKEKATVKMSATDTYLKVGDSYTFSVRYDAEYDIYRIIVPEYGSVKIKEFKDKEKNHVLIKEYKEAIKSINK